MSELALPLKRLAMPMFGRELRSPEAADSSPQLVAKATPTLIDLRDTTLLYSALEHLFKDHSSEHLARFSRFEQPVGNGRNFLMPARLGNFEAFKIIRSRPANTACGLERSQSSILITDTRTGRDLHLVSGAELTPFKASALTALALDRWLAAHPSEPIRLGIIGGGSVARSHLVALSSRYGSRIEKSLIYSPRDAAARIVGELGLSHGVLLADREKILHDCNVIVTATPSQTPSVSLGELHDRPTFLSGVGFYDLSTDAILGASQILSEDPLSYIQSAKPLGSLCRNDPTGKLTDRVAGLSEIFQGKAALTPGGITAFMQYGTAMTDLAVIIAAMNLNSQS